MCTRPSTIVCRYPQRTIDGLCDPSTKDGTRDSTPQGEPVAYGMGRSSAQYFTQASRQPKQTRHRSLAWDLFFSNRPGRRNFAEHNEQTMLPHRRQ